MLVVCFANQLILLLADKKLVVSGELEANWSVKVKSWTLGRVSNCSSPTYVHRSTYIQVLKTPTFSKMRKYRVISIEMNLLRLL